MPMIHTEPRVVLTGLHGSESFIFEGPATDGEQKHPRRQDFWNLIRKSQQSLEHS
jgi:hypothetical protein